MAVQAPAAQANASATSVGVGPFELVAMHCVFALTAVFHVVGGALLPSLQRLTGLDDGHAGFLFFLYFLGTSLGALLCGQRQALRMRPGYVAMAACALLVALGPASWLQVVFLLLGVSVGVPLSSVSILAGRKYGANCAAPLTLLNFSWSVGALAAPLLAARLLGHYDYRLVYELLAALSLLAALACVLWVKEPAETAVATAAAGQGTAWRWVLLFAFLAFLQVGIENTAVTWLAVYAQRTLQSEAAVAAAVASFFWCGYLGSRAVSSFLLLRLKAERVLWTAVGTALAAAILLLMVNSPWLTPAAMFVLGAALAPIFPLILAGFFTRVRNSADSRWVLACSGFGGSILPWLTGVVSSRSGSIRLGLCTVPVALLLVLICLGLLRRVERAEAAARVA